MKARTLLLLIAMAAVGAFVLLNWGAIMMPTTLHLGVTTLDAPLGIFMLALLALLTAAFLIFVVYLQTTVLLDSRRHARELQANRELADQAEASRFTELRGVLEADREEQRALDAQSKAELLARMAQLEQELRAAIEQSTTSLSAYLGELEDRVDKSLQQPRQDKP